MSHKGKNHDKKWLLSRMKTSGSKRKYVVDGDYADTRKAKGQYDAENLPKQESMGKSQKFYGGKINYGLLVRFLRGKAGQDWEIVHAEILERIPTDLYEYKDCIRWFVAEQVEKRDDGLWDKKEHKYLRVNGDEPIQFDLYTYKEFYVDPDSNILAKIKDRPSERSTKELDARELRAFREHEKQEKLKEKKIKKAREEEIDVLSKELFSNSQKNGE
jgi:hypothetical protein